MVDELERVRQHQPFHLAVVNAAPMRSREKRPTDLNLASHGIVAMKPRQTDDAIVFMVQRDQGAAGLKRFIKKLSKHVGFVTVRVWMLLPYQRVGSDGIQLFEIVSSQWPQFE